MGYIQIEDLGAFEIRPLRLPKTLSEFGIKRGRNREDKGAVHSRYSPKQPIPDYLVEELDGSRSVCVVYGWRGEPNADEIGSGWGTRYRETSSGRLVQIGHKAYLCAVPKEGGPYAVIAEITTEDQRPNKALDGLAQRFDERIAGLILAEACLKTAV